MSDSIPLSENVIQDLLPLPRAGQALALLTRVGPLAENEAAFTLPVADLAYLVFLAWLRTPLRQGKPGYEGWETVSARVRAAMMTYPRTPADFGFALFGRLEEFTSALPDADRLWWRRVCAEMPAEVWRPLRSVSSQEEILSAAGFLRSWLFEIKPPAPPIPPVLPGKRS